MSIEKQVAAKTALRSMLFYLCELSMLFLSLNQVINHCYLEWIYWIDILNVKRFWLLHREKFHCKVKDFWTLSIKMDLSHSKCWEVRRFPNICLPDDNFWILKMEFIPDNSIFRKIFSRLIFLEIKISRIFFFLNS